MFKHPHFVGTLLIGSLLWICGFSDGPLAEIQTAILQQDYAKAQQLAEALIAGQPPKPELQEAQYYLGLSQLNSGEPLAAQKLFEQILSSQPDRSLQDRCELGIIDAFLLEGEFDSALEGAQRLLKESPQSQYLSLIYFKIGRAHFKMAHWEDATQNLQFLLDRFPASPEAHLARQLMAEKHYFAVQVGSFHDQGLAERLAQDMRRKFPYSYIVETTDKNGEKFYRVRVGQFSRLDEALALAKRLSQLGYPTLIYP